MNNDSPLIADVQAWMRAQDKRPAADVDISGQVVSASYTLDLQPTSKTVYTDQPFTDVSFHRSSTRPPLQAKRVYIPVETPVRAGRVVLLGVILGLVLMATAMLHWAIALGVFGLIIIGMIRA